MSSTAELGKDGGADQAKMQLLGQQRTKKNACCKRLRFNCFGKSTDYHKVISINGFNFLNKKYNITLKSLNLQSTFLLKSIHIYYLPYSTLKYGLI